MLEMVPVSGNTFPVKDSLKAMGGRWDADAKVWKVPSSKAFAARELVPPWPVKAAPVEVGGMGAILALFATAKSHLKRPAIVLGVAGVAPGVRLSVAGVAAKVPGSINVATAEPFGANTWFGRITKGGVFEPSRQETPAALVPALRAFACDPAGEAAKHGKLTGACCFCNKSLTDERSTAVGYGETCAKHYGLPWGKPEAIVMVKKAA